MNWISLLHTIGEEPVFSSSLLLTPGENRGEIQKQLSRWTRVGKLLQLRRGLYALAPPYRKTVPAHFLVGNRLRPASYVSLQSALAYYGMIPEYVPEITSVTTGRPEKLDTPLGRYSYRHLAPSLFYGYHRIEIAHSQEAHVAYPEKALLDLIYLTPNADREDYLEELRLQNLEIIDRNRLDQFAIRSGKPKLERAVRTIMQIAEGEEYESL